ncbi:unnamed protein product [Prorocentrum cordatum]|uniref:Uncharacterized protein n=1 Tax=Prorocentrum cordatum TaxID=2364126 RepID=A0ABN9RJG9_9DINO|nr:unnamed protein product [Polarella glacialis]
MHALPPCKISTDDEGRERWSGALAGGGRMRTCGDASGAEEDLGLETHAAHHVMTRRSEPRIEKFGGEELRVARGSGLVDLLTKACSEEGPNFCKHPALAELRAKAR